MNSCYSVKPVRSSSSAERTSISLESYTHTLSCIGESLLDLTTLRNLVKVLQVNGFSTGTKKKGAKADIAQYIQSLPLFHPCFSSVHTIVSGDPYDNLTEVQIQITPMAMNHTELSQDFAALETWFKMDQSADGLLKSTACKLDHERLRDTSSDNRIKSCNNAIDLQMKQYTVPQLDDHGGSTLRSSPGTLLGYWGKKESFSPRESSDSHSLVKGCSNKLNSGKEAINPPDVHHQDHVFTDSDSVLQDSVCNDLHGEAMNHEDLLHVSMPCIFITESRKDAIGSQHTNGFPTSRFIGNGSPKPASRIDAKKASCRGDPSSSFIAVSALASSSRSVSTSTSSASRNDPFTSSSRKLVPVSSSFKNAPLTSTKGNVPSIKTNDLSITNPSIFSAGNTLSTSSTSSTQTDPLTSLNRNVSSTSSIIGINASVTSVAGNPSLAASARPKPLISSDRNVTDLMFPIPSASLASLMGNAHLTSSVRNDSLTPSSVRNDALTSSSLRNDSLTAFSKQNDILTFSSVGNDPPITSAVRNNQATETAVSKAFDKDVISSAMLDMGYNNVQNFSSMLSNDIAETTKALSFPQDSSTSTSSNLQLTILSSGDGGASAGFLQLMNDGSFSDSLSSNISETFDLLSRWENRRKKQAINNDIKTNEKTSDSTLCDPFPKHLKRKREQ